MIIPLLPGKLAGLIEAAAYSAVGCDGDRLPADQFGDTGKGAGAASFELFKYQALSPNHRGDRLATWTVDFNNPKANKEHWDGITRTYLFKLPMPAGAVLKDKLLLIANLTLPNGAKLTDDIPLAAPAVK